MKITVHRGTNQIGGCVTEYESKGWKLFVDYGEQLPSAPMYDKKLEIDGLTCGDMRKRALLITHYHGDHIGKITELPAELPIYMGKMAKDSIPGGGSCAGGLLCGLVRPLQGYEPGGRGAGEGVRGKSEGGKDQHRREPEYCH